MKALVDGDLVAYRCAASANNEPLDVAIYRCDKLMRDLLEQVNADSYIAYLTGKSNFRKEINPDYKANRKDQEPPQWLEQCKEYLVVEWNAKLKEWYEADDLLGIEQCRVSSENEGCAFSLYNETPTIIISLDKDLRMIPGEHYSWEISTEKWVKPAEFTTISQESGIRKFYEQMLIGDTTDNIFGITGLGPVKSKKYLSSAETEQELFDLVYNKYDDPQRFLINAQCLWICRNEGETWAHRANGLILDEYMMGLVNAAIIQTTSLLNIMVHEE